MMNKLNSNDYYKIRIYHRPSKYIMKKYHEEHKNIFNEDNKIKTTKYIKIFDIHIKIMLDFKWKFIEYISGFKLDMWYNFYMYDTTECAIEYIWESTDILIIKDRNYYTFYIPKRYQEYYEWVLNNIPKKFKYKILKRESIPWFYQDKKNCKYTRELSLERSKRFFKIIQKNQ